MIEGADRMQQMVRSLLVYSGVSTKGMAFEQIDLNTLIEDLKAFELAGQLEQAHGNISIVGQLPAVKGDPDQVRQLLQNLVSNALKYRKKDIAPEVIVRAHTQDHGMVRIELQDNGIGVPAKRHDDIFVMFRRLHSRNDYDGTGIGLAVCKRVVERHQGKTGVTSEPGQGATFWFTLPLAQSAGTQYQESPSALAG